MAEPLTLDDPEDLKIVVLARATRARTHAVEGACVRDTDGRTYAAAAVDLPSLTLSSLQVAVAMAASSGAQGLEAAALVTDRAGPSEADLAAVRDLGGTGVPIFVAAADGSVSDRVST
jgi:hypothetical protein